MRQLQLSPSQTNLFGGTLSIAHPSGVTAMRLIQNAFLALEQFPGHEFGFTHAIAATPSITGEGCALLFRRVK